MASDPLNQLGKTLKRGGQRADRALKRYSSIRPRIERVLDIFDSTRPFTFTFDVDDKEQQILLSLVFKGPPPNDCCSGNICGVCETFTSGDEVIILSRAYIPNSVALIINGRSRNEFTETNPSERIVTINLNTSPGTLVRICYTYSVQPLNPGDTVVIIPPGEPGGGGTVIIPGGVPPAPTNLQGLVEDGQVRLSWE